MHDFQIHIGEQSRKEKAVLKSEEHSLLVWAEKPTEQKIPPRKLCSHPELIKIVFWKCVYGLWISLVTPGDSQAQSFFKLLKFLLQARAELAPCSGSQTWPQVIIRNSVLFLINMETPQEKSNQKPTKPNQIQPSSSNWKIITRLLSSRYVCLVIF